MTDVWACDMRALSPKKLCCHGVYISSKLKCSYVLCFKSIEIDPRTASLKVCEFWLKCKNYVASETKMSPFTIYIASGVCISCMVFSFSLNIRDVLLVERKKKVFIIMKCCPYFENVHAFYIWSYSLMWFYFILWFCYLHVFYIMKVFNWNFL